MYCNSGYLAIGVFSKEQKKKTNTELFNSWVSQPLSNLQRCFTQCFSLCVTCYNMNTRATLAYKRDCNACCMWLHKRERAERKFNFVHSFSNLILFMICGLQKGAMRNKGLGRGKLLISWWAESRGTSQELRQESFPSRYAPANLPLQPNPTSQQVSCMVPQFNHLAKHHPCTWELWRIFLI